MNGVPYVDHAMLSPDKSRVAGEVAGNLVVVTSNGRSTERLDVPSAYPLCWSRASDAVFALRVSGSAFQVLKVSVPSGELAVSKTITPQNRADLETFSGFAAAPEANAFAYSELVNSSRLYFVDGWFS